MPTSCRFVFTRASPIYYGGEQVTGHVYLTTTKKLLLEAINLTFVGTASVQWIEKSKFPIIEHNDSTKADNHIQYTGKQEYIKDDKALAENIILLPTTTHIYDFCFSIPKHSAATCEHEHGKVAYKLHLILKRRKIVFNKQFKQIIVIKNRLDLQQLENWNERCFINNSILNTEFSLCCSGFVPGQLIKYQLRCSQLRSKFNKVLINFCQRLTYKSQQPQAEIKHVLKVIASNKLKIDGNSICEKIIDGALSIPLAVAITSSGNEKHLMQVSYFMEAVIVDGKSNSILTKLLIPIVIGTIAPLPGLTAAIICDEYEAQYCYDNFASTVANNIKVNSILCDTKQQHHEITTSNCKQIYDKITLLPLKRRNTLQKYR